MTDQRTNPEVDEYLQQVTQWQEESEKLRGILLDCQLTEDLKWGKPCYAFEGGNVAIIQGFKEACALMFFRGALLSDPSGILEKPGPNSRAARRIVFTDVSGIVKLEGALRGYIKEAIEVERAGLEVELEESEELDIPEEFEAKLEEVPGLQAAFHALTPGRQREYILYFSSAKQSKTRESRVERYVQKILDGKGMRDQATTVPRNTR